jgi:hypothetical protein
MMLNIYLNNSVEELQPIISDGENRVIVVFLSHIKQGEKKNFRCINCGRVTFQYQDSIATIVDSPDTPIEKSTLEILCDRCKIIYKVV